MTHHAAPAACGVLVRCLHTALGPRATRMGGRSRAPVLLLVGLLEIIADSEPCPARVTSAIRECVVTFVEWSRGRFSDCPRRFVEAQHFYANESVDTRRPAPLYSPGCGSKDDLSVPPLRYLTGVGKSVIIRTGWGVQAIAGITLCGDVYAGGCTRRPTSWKILNNNDSLGCRSPGLDAPGLRGVNADV